MYGLIIRWFILSVAIVVAAYLFPGIHVKSFGTALVAALVLGILNAFFRPILIILTLPINVLTLGLFTFVINAFLLMMTSGVIGGLVVNGFGSALLGSLIISIVSWLLSSFINDQGRIESIQVELHQRRDGRWQ
ncbi:MAG: phage holin family protein [Deltaproteobacteria bacterium]|nr:phage holin family protein [Deltaproteobacteria bacterium]MBW2478076.1 phage holin family protein [Deltaproteobacteria bacterium]MBW2504886.1 phage holin family protein [Deltaproteobacteria bacterium]